MRIQVTLCDACRKEITDTDEHIKVSGYNEEGAHTADFGRLRHFVELEFCRLPCARDHLATCGDHLRDPEKA